MSDHQDEAYEDLKKSKQSNNPVRNKKTIKETKTSGNSFDNMSFHPSILKHLGKKALKVLSKQFNLCISKGKWVWKSSDVIFLKKPGKDGYHQPGS